MTTTRDRRAAGDATSIQQTLRDSAYERLDNQKKTATTSLGSLAGAVRGMAQPLRESGQPSMADYATRAADGLERWASQLNQQDIRDAVRGVQRFARRQPALFMGIAFGAGLLAARFFKSSSDSGEYQSRNYGSQHVGDWQPSPPLTAPPAAPTSNVGPLDSTPRISRDLRSGREAL